MTTVMTIDTFKASLPKDANITVNQELVDDFNNLMTDEVERDAFRDNLVSYSSVLANGKYKAQTYVDAVKFVTFKLLGSNNTMAYAKAFPLRYQRLLDDGAPMKTISTYASAFNKGALCQAIQLQTITPTWVLNNDKFQQAINVQAGIMNDLDVSPKVRSDAANSILTHLKPPEAQKVEIEVGTSNGSKIDALREATLELVRQNEQQLADGTATALDIAHSSIIPKEKVINP